MKPRRVADKAYSVQGYAFILGKLRIMGICRIFLVGDEAPSFPGLNKLAVCVILIPAVKAVSRVGDCGENHFFSPLILLTDIVCIFVLFARAAGACVHSMLYMHNSSEFRGLHLKAVAVHSYENSVIPFARTRLYRRPLLRLGVGFGMAVLRKFKGRRH